MIFWDFLTSALCEVAVSLELFCTTENPIFPENSVSFPENLF
jgi:hypothetical protein